MNQIVNISLRLWGRELCPDEVSKAIGIKATASHVRGYKKKLPGGKLSAPRKTGAWSYTRDIHSNFEYGIQEFVDTFSYLDLLALDNVEAGAVDLLFGLSSQECTVIEPYECVLNAKVVADLYKLGLDVRVTIV